MRFDRRAFGLDLRLAEFLVLAPVSCVAAFAILMGVQTALRIGEADGLGASFWVFLGGLWVMALHYIVATIPSIMAWGLAVRLARAVGMSADGAVRIAAPFTALVASLLLLTWFSDPDYRGMVPAITIISMLTSTLVVLRLSPPPVAVQADETPSVHPPA